MRHITEKLYQTQKELLRAPLGSPVWRSSVQALSASVPAPILSHYLRLVTTGRPGVSLVRHGVCSECHIRVGFGVVAALQDPQDLHLCDHCGCYLLLPEEEFTAAKTVRRTPRVTAKPRPVVV